MITANMDVTVKIESCPYYGGTVAKVLEVRPLRTALVQMFNGRKFVMSTGDLEPLK